MAQEQQLPEIKLDATQLYREEIFTDRKAGTLRRLVPVKTDGSEDCVAPVLYSGQTQLLTPAGVLPLAFELEASVARRRVQQIPRRREDRHRTGHRRGARDAPRSRVAHRGAATRRRHGWRACRRRAHQALRAAAYLAPQFAIEEPHRCWRARASR